ncbi:putative GTP cyclohydrolase 1 type 2 [mine drainage metagenome]|uniref:Putative GTP cyclohydrolase 1 type 2 n=1 Tax=mine drainage metagenome TaxID=410659 RepID=A0A1J5RA31_9ZZZZ
MKIAEIIETLEKISPTVYQEDYDNCGLIIGKADWECTGIVCSLDATEDVILEAKTKGCNLVVVHHPIIFSGLKKINGKNYVEDAVIAAIKNDIAVYAIHTNLDNVIDGVNNKIADALGLIHRKILLPKQDQLMKLFTFVPVEYGEKIKSVLFEAGGGNIGNYSECSFSVEGTGNFKAGNNTEPFTGEIGKRHYEKELKIEVVFPAYLQNKIVEALIAAHPYEEVAYDVVALANDFSKVGSGLIAELPGALDETEFLAQIKAAFGLQAIKHTNLLGKKIKKVAVCGGAGSFLIGRAVAAGADIFITSDVKYHEFFDANGKMVIADIGHWESEQFTVDLLIGVLKANFPTFAVLKSEVRTNPVRYFL